jgi:hypothetical protein
MHVEQVLIELAPHLLNGVGPGSIRWQREQGDATVMLAQRIEYLAMKMHRPVKSQLERPPAITIGSDSAEQNQSPPRGDAG